MTTATTYDYGERSISYINNLVEVIRFIMINTILAFIFLFLIIEEVDWLIFSSKKRAIDKVIDDTSWNIKKLIW